jgi:hypothetical protein
VIFDGIRGEIVEELASARQELVVARNQTSAQTRASARERVIDGLLRGWPIPVPDDQTLESKVDNLQAKNARDAWTKILGRLAGQGIDVGDGSATAGTLNRGNVFFSVRGIGGDRYRITPTYVVSGPYLEVWDPARHTVTIESKSEAVVQSMLADQP